MAPVDIAIAARAPGYLDLDISIAVLKGSKLSAT
jgi:hypothetical protein